MKIQPRQPRGFILTAVLLGMAAWALAPLNLNPPGLTVSMSG